MELRDQLKEATTHIKNLISFTPQFGLVLGSGLGALAEQVENPIRIPYDQIPHFPTSTVEGHAGELVIGTLEGKPVLVLGGRFHYYEGYSMNKVVFPIRCMKMLGIDNLIVTNAAGSVHPDFTPGRLMLIKDHIKMVTDSPLRGLNLDEFGPRFNDMSDPYTTEIRDLAKACAGDLNIDLGEGVYCYMPGPSYETASEVRMLNMIGAHAVGMSTVPEVITATHAGMKIMGLSCITNMATGILNQPLTHDEVKETAEKVKDAFSKLILTILHKWP
ncbi:purine-nucleoside phosphorylase [Desulfobacterales bacterium HSG17]|nr:purine-nucleoside phosphorylase [Desulfobacterales bacterium HSG17]